METRQGSRIRCRRPSSVAPKALASPLGTARRHCLGAREGAPTLLGGRERGRRRCTYTTAAAVAVPGFSFASAVGEGNF